MSSNTLKKHVQMDPHRGLYMFHGNSAASPLGLSVGRLTFSQIGKCGPRESTLITNTIFWISRCSLKYSIASNMMVKQSIRRKTVLTSAFIN
ncbi:hypothetical protein scyTo_0010221 [Scyliorhinus torazame]|uniref:Uncharacterized protein n=1 Tax=Scyliorhinus torazame TaxID=75743 RepID=A0A401P2B4_SCYTO|nr:hypothetical protein [Scyliorhinus torazame]